MAQEADSVARYHRLMEDGPYRDLAWAEDLQERMRRHGLTECGRLVSPILRPHFISRRQAAAVSRSAEQLSSILNQFESILAKRPTLLNRIRLLPAEKMLAAVPTRYSGLSVTSRIDTHLQNGSLQFRGFRATTPLGVAYSEPLADLFLGLPIVKEFQRGHGRLTKLGGGNGLLDAILKAWSEYGGTRMPHIAVVEYQQPSGVSSNEGLFLAAMLGQQQRQARVLSPDHLEYRDGRLRSGEFEVDVVFRRIRTRELLVRSDLSHPLLRAYRDGAVCMVNSFRSEIAQRLALFDLLTDDRVTCSLSAEDRKLIHDLVPWTRILAETKTFYGDQPVDLIHFTQHNRERLVLRPDEENAEHQTYVGAEMTAAGWERAMRSAIRTPYVVQERFTCDTQLFPLFRHGELQMKEAEISIQPHLFNGKVHGISAGLQTCTGGFRTPLAVAPVFLLE